MLEIINSLVIGYLLLLPVKFLGLEEHVGLPVMLVLFSNILHDYG